MCTFKRIAHAQALDDNETGKVLASHLQHFCTVTRRANARAVLRQSCEQDAGRSTIAMRTSVIELATPSTDAVTVAPPVAAAAPRPPAYSDIRLRATEA